MRAQVRDDPRLAAQSVPLICTQIRIIRWSAEELARHTALSVTTIRRAELRRSATVLTRTNDQAIRRALEQAGVGFIDAEGGGPRAAGDTNGGEVVFKAPARPPQVSLPARNLGGAEMASPGGGSTI